MTDPGEVMDVFFEDKDYMDRWLQNHEIMEMLECLRGTNVNIVVHQIQDANQFKAFYILQVLHWGERPALGEVKPGGWKSLCEAFTLFLLCDC